MRVLSEHEVNGANQQLRIQVCDEPGHGGASHCYEISGFDSRSNPSDTSVALYGEPADHVQLLFQNGPIRESGVNGITHEALLAVLCDRMRAFQKGKYACRENEMALTALEEAQMWLMHRTKKRLGRGVEGTHAI